MIEKEYKNYYKISFGTYSGVIVDEMLIKKLSKLQYETQEKLKELLINNLEHVETENWSLAYPRGEQTSFEYVGMQIFPKQDRIKLIHNMFSIRKIKHLYRTDMKWSLENLKLMEEFAKKDMEHEEIIV